jgi:hypothetical protein
MVRHARSYPRSPSYSLIRYCKTTKDHLVRLYYWCFQRLHLFPHFILYAYVIYTHTTYFQVPSVWGPVGKGEDPYAPPQTGCTCIVM